MQSDKHLNGAVFIYFLVLIMMVILNMLKGINMLDVIYLITLICCSLKCMIIVRADRK